MVEIHDMRYKLCGGNVHFAADKYVDSLKGFIREQHFHEVFPDGAGCADDQCFHQIVSWGLYGFIGRIYGKSAGSSTHSAGIPFPGLYVGIFCHSGIFRIVAWIVYEWCGRKSFFRPQNNK